MYTERRRYSAISAITATATSGARQPNGMQPKQPPPRARLPELFDIQTKGIADVALQA